MDLIPVIQIGITIVGSCIVPLAAKWIDMRIAEKLLDAESRLKPILQELKDHNKESDVIHRDLDIRVAVVENGHASISERLDIFAQEMTRFRELVDKRVH